MQNTMDELAGLDGFGPRLALAIEASPITASDLARELGISPQAVYNYKNRDGGLAVDKLFQIAEVLNVDAGWLVTGYRQPVRPIPGQTANANDVSARIREAMIGAGIGSETQLASQSGVDTLALSRILCDDPIYLLDDLVKVASACRVTVGWLVGETIEPEGQQRQTAAQSDWLGLMTDLGSDDIAEFTLSITQRQVRNRKLVQELHDQDRRPAPRSSRMRP